MRAVKQPSSTTGRYGRVEPITREVVRPDLFDLDLEREVLAAGITFPEVVLPSAVDATDFYSGPNAVIWSTLLRLIADGETPDTLRVIGALGDAARLENVGGADYIRSLTDGIPTRNPPFDRLRRLARQRRVQEASSFVTSRVGDPDLPTYRARLEQAWADLDALSGGNRSGIYTRSTAEIFAPLEPTQWSVPGLHIGAGRPTLFAGYGSSAKTLSAQSLALAVASGTFAWGHFETRTGRVLHLDYEQGWKATARRYQRLALGHGIDPARLGNRLQTAIFPRVFLDSPNAVDAYAAACDGVDLVVLDALRGATPTMDENDSSIRTCVDNLTLVSEKTGCAFVLLHHAGKPKDGHGNDPRTIARGSSAIFDAAGCVLVVLAGKDKSAPRRVVEVKTPAEAEGAAFDDFALLVEDVEVDGNATAGVRVVWRPVEAEDPIAANRAALTVEAERVLRVISERPGQSVRQIRAEAGMQLQRVGTVLERLEDEGRVRCVAGPRGAKLFYPGDAR